MDKYYKKKARQKEFNDKLRKHVINVLNETEYMNPLAMPLSYYWLRVLDDSDSKYNKEARELTTYCTKCYTKHEQAYHANKCCNKDGIDNG